MTATPYYGSAQRVPHRMLFSAAALDGDDAEPGANVCWFSTEVAHWQMRSAHIAIVSDRGGIPLHLASRASDKYDGRPVWAAGVTVAAGDEYGFAHSIYEALSAGVTGATAPTHLSGDASDGAVTWRFKERIMRTPVSLSVTYVQDIYDGNAGWPAHIEGIQKPGASSLFSEWVVKAGQNVINDPYNPTPSKCALGPRFISGGDHSYAPSDFNSTAALTFEKSSNSDCRWFSALVVAQDAIAPDTTGAMRPIKLGRQHRQSWYTAAASIGAEIWSEVTSSLERMGLVFWNRSAQIQCLGVPAVSFESATNPGSAPDNYPALIAHPAANGFVELRARSNTGAADVDVKVSPKGAGKLRVGSYQPVTTESAVTGFIEIKDANGVIRKLAVIA